MHLEMVRVQQYFKSEIHECNYVSGRTYTSINMFPSLSVLPHNAPPKYGVHGLSFHSLLSLSFTLL
jgi:hypothetical protein